MRPLPELCARSDFSPNDFKRCQLYVVIDAANRNNMLLPGMTATVDFIVEEREDFL